jgi:hypothetical protein
MGWVDRLREGTQTQEENNQKAKWRQLLNEEQVIIDKQASNAFDEQESHVVLESQLPDGAQLKDGDQASWNMHDSLARKSKTSEKISYLNDGNLPEGAVAKVLKGSDGSDTLVYHFPESEDQNFYHIDNPGAGLEEFGYATGNILTAENAGATVVQLSPIGRVKNAGTAVNWLTKLLAESGGAAAGRVVDNGAQELAGHQEDELTDGTGEAAFFGGMGKVGADTVNALGTGVLRMVKGVKGTQGVPDMPLDLKTNLTGDAGEVHKFATENGLPFTYGDTGNPIAQRIENLGAMVSPSVKETIDKKRTGPIELLSKERDQSMPGYMGNDGQVVEDNVAHLLDDAQLSKIIGDAGAREHDKTLALLSQGSTPTSKNDAGMALKTALVEGEGSALNQRKVRVNNLYEQGIKLAQEQGDDISFDLSSVKQLVSDVLDNPKLYAEPEVTTSTNKFTGVKTQSSETPASISIKPDLANETKNAARLLLKAADEQNGPEAMRAIKQLRTNLFDASQPAQGMMHNQSTRAASKLYGELSEIMHNPKGGSEAFTNTWKQASNANREMMEFSENARIKKLAKSNDGEKIYQDFAGNMTETQAQFLRTELAKKPEALKQFKGAAVQDMMENPNSISGQLRKLKQLISPGEAKVLQTYEVAMKRIDQSAVNKALTAQTDVANRLGELLKSNQPKAAMDFLLNYGGKEYQPMIRAAMFQNIIDSSSSSNAGRLMVEPSKLEGLVKKYKANGLYKLFSPTQQKLLTNVKNYTSFINSGDSGSGIAGSALAAQLGNITKPKAAASAAMNILATARMGRLAQNEALVRALIAPVKPNNALTAPIAAMIRSSRELQNESVNGYDN